MLKTRRLNTLTDQKQAGAERRGKHDKLTVKERKWQN